MTRTTGATDAQIEAGARRLGSRSGREIDAQDIAESTDVMSFFVPPDHRIVRVDDLRAIEGAVDWRRQPWRIREAFNRLQAAIGEAE